MTKPSMHTLALALLFGAFAQPSGAAPARQTLTPVTHTDAEWKTVTAYVRVNGVQYPVHFAETDGC